VELITAQWHLLVITQQDMGKKWQIKCAEMLHDVLSYREK